jgi:hypothetical protein
MEISVAIVTGRANRPYGTNLMMKQRYGLTGSFHVLCVIL